MVQSLCLRTSVPTKPLILEWSVGSRVSSLWGPGEGCGDQEAMGMCLGGPGLLLEDPWHFTWEGGTFLQMPCPERPECPPSGGREDVAGKGPPTNLHQTRCTVPVQQLGSQGHLSFTLGLVNTTFNNLVAHEMQCSRLETAAEIARDTKLLYKNICCLQNICKKAKKKKRPKASSLLIFFYLRKEFS